jgi:DNA repair exonuclease SbcCD nuclease subunit
MKILFYTDPHVSGVSPSHRIDDYGMSIVEKIRESYQIAKDNGCDIVVLGGDLFNNHRMYSFEILNDLLDIIDGSPVHTYAVIGQHDVLGYNKDSFRTSTLAFVVRRCSKLHILWEPQEVDGVVLHPSHVWDDVNASLTPESLDAKKVNILVAHHLIHNKPKMFETVPTVLFANAPYELVLSGDWHGGFEPHQINGRWFCNPGSLARREIDDIDKVPQVAVIDIAKGKEVQIRQVALKSAKPGKEVFDVGVVEIIKKSQTDFDPSNFIANIEEFESQSVDVFELIQKIGLAQKTRKDILEYLSSKRA